MYIYIYIYTTNSFVCVYIYRMTCIIIVLNNSGKQAVLTAYKCLNIYIKEISKYFFCVPLLLEYIQ